MENSETMQQQEDKRPTFRERVLALLADNAEKIAALSKLDILRITRLVYYESIENFEIEIKTKDKAYPTEFKIKDSFSEWDEGAETDFRTMLDSLVSNARKEMRTLTEEIKERLDRAAKIGMWLEGFNDNTEK